MKTLHITLIAMAMLLVASCSDDDATTGKLTSEEQAEMIAASLGESGFTSSAEQSAIYATESTAEAGKLAACGYSTTETLSVSNPAGTLITYAYEYTYEAALICSDLTPQSLTCTFSYDGSFDAPRLASSHTGEGSLSVTALDGISTSFELNGSYDRAGGFESKIGRRNSGNSEVILTVEDVMVNKTTYVIESGSVTANASGDVAGTTFSFSAVVTFLGDGTATITINGITYRADLTSGELILQ